MIFAGLLHMRKSLRTFDVRTSGLVTFLVVFVSEKNGNLSKFPDFLEIFRCRSHTVFCYVTQKNIAGTSKEELESCSKKSQMTSTIVFSSLNRLIFWRRQVRQMISTLSTKSTKNFAAKLSESLHHFFDKLSESLHHFRA